VEITVSDEGPGIPAGILPRVFDPFFTTKPDGSGLGLAMSHSIVQAHGGRIAVSSLPGGGATFCVWLPAAPEQAARPEPALTDVTPAGPHYGRIILMDDEPLIRDMASRMLTRGGYDVTAVRDGRDVLDMCRQALAAGKPFDAAILDVTVPGGMGGLETLRLLRVLQPGLPVVLSTGYGEGPATAGGEQPTAVLPKPYQMHELLACARAVVHSLPLTRE
jgi:two-component system cell cycle sensor histidine kinase/response regulator CckA